MPNDYATCARCGKTFPFSTAIWVNRYQVEIRRFCGYACASLYCIGKLTDADRDEVAQAWADAIGK